MRNVIMTKWSGWVLALAAGCCLTLGTPAQACSGPQNAAKMTSDLKLKMEMAKLRVLPHNPSEDSANVEKAHDVTPPSIVGLWDVQFFAGTQLVGEIYDLWHADGTEIEVDASNPIEGNVCNGVYNQTGTLTYRLTHPSWGFDGNGNLVATVMIREVITLDPRGDNYTGTETVDVFDLSGHLIEHDEGTLKGTRIKPD